MPTPSMSANRMPPIIAEPTMANGPPGGERRQGEVRAGKTGWRGLGPGLGVLTAGSQHSPGQRSTGDGVPGIFLAPQPHQAAVDGGEQAPPHRKATYRGTKA